MTTLNRVCLVLSLSMLVTCAYSPSALAGKKDGSNSSSDDKKKDKDDEQNSQSGKRDRNRNDNQKLNVQKVQNAQQVPSVQKVQNPFLVGNNNTNNTKNNASNDNQGGSKNSQQFINGNGPQNSQFQKSPQLQNNQLQNNQKQSPWQNGQKQPQGQDNDKQLQGQNNQKQPQWQNNQKQPQWQNNQKQNDNQQELQKKNDKGDWKKHGKQDHKDVHNWVVQFGGPEPFSVQWYKDHPKAWHHHHHDHDDAWKVGTTIGVLGFLGWQAYHTPTTVVVYEPLPYDRIFVQSPAVVIDPARGDWMPLGVFSLIVGVGDESTRMLDLAVDRFGHIRGTYYDMISGASHDVAGIIDARTQYAQWSLESNRQLTFYTPLGEMMQPQGFVYVQLPSGQRQQWQLVRMERAGY